MWFALFLTITLILFLLPLIPSLLELNHATDTKPLRIVQEYDTEVTHFAVGFKAWLEKNFSEFFAVGRKTPKGASDGTLEDSTVFQIIGSNGVPSYSSKESKSRTTHKLILSASSLRLSEKMFFESEIYSAGDIQAGTQSQFRALLAEGDIELGERSTVLRWAHSHASLHAAAGCKLFGRTSADKNLVLEENCCFERLHAGKIVFGKLVATAKRPQAAPTVLKTLPNVKDRYERRWLIDGDIDIPEHRSFNGDLVATGDIHIGAGAHITGSLKSTRNMYLAADARIDGAIVSSGNIHMEAGCFVAGPVIAEHNLLIKEGAIIGSRALPTTVTAPNILIANGVTAFGTVWADESAAVMPADGSSV